MSFLARTVRLNQILSAHRLRKHLAVTLVQSNQMHNRALIGSRDVVGFGFNGSYYYFDATDMPYPAIRFREETDEIKKLREKEKDDWNKLTIYEKKQRNYMLFVFTNECHLTIIVHLQFTDTTFVLHWLKWKVPPANGKFNFPLSYTPFRLHYSTLDLPANTVCVYIFFSR